MGMIFKNIINQEILHWGLYSNLSLLLLLVIASYFDEKEFRIPDKLNLTFLIVRLILSCFIGIGLGNLYGLIAGLLIILIPAMIMMKPMGGDIKMFAVLGLYLGVQNVLVLLVGTVFASVIPAILKKRDKGEGRKDIPLAPYVLVSFIIMNLINFL